MRLLSSLCFSLLAAGPALAAETHPFSVTDMLAMEPVPDALVRQLAPGGRMILPLRASHREAQRLVLIERTLRGVLESELDAVRFVPMQTGKA